MIRIAFIKDWHDDLEHLGGNFDGILAAVAELAKRHDVGIITRRTATTFDGETEIHGVKHYFQQELSYKIGDWADVILCWGSLDRPWHSQLPKSIPAVLCFAGGPTTHENLRHFQHVCVESEVYLKAFQSQGITVSRAFGTNSSLFRPEPRSPKILRAIYPASFCFHKNIELFARAMRGQGLAVGSWNEESIVGKCLELGTPVLRRVSSNALCDLYNMSHVTVVPCGPNGGAQRVVLESLACGVPVVLSEDNDKCVEFITESGFGRLVPPIAEAIREAVDDLIAKPLDRRVGREYIMSKWTHHHYADALESAIKSVTGART